MVDHALGKMAKQIFSRYSDCTCIILKMTFMVHQRQSTFVANASIKLSYCSENNNMYFKYISRATPFSVPTSCSSFRILGIYSSETLD